jgi:hypothetical protein
MRCENEVIYMTEIGDSMQYRETMVRCGTTDPHGNRCICEECESNPSIMQSIWDHEANVEADNAWLRSAGYGEY